MKLQARLALVLFALVTGCPNSESTPDMSASGDAGTDMAVVQDMATNADLAGDMTGNTDLARDAASQIVCTFDDPASLFDDCVVAP
jgi:hypothetical protein